MTKKSENALRKLSRAELAGELETYRALLAQEPENAEAKEAIAFIEQLLAAPEAPAAEAKPDAKAAREAKIVNIMNLSSCTREGAEQVLRDQEAADKAKK